MDTYQVAKAIITIEHEGDSHYLMSVKHDPGNKSDGKLEFLGGRFEPDETPHEALVRELSEEEASGHLARLATDRASVYFSVTAGDAEHFLFPFFLDKDEYDLLRHHPDESAGFELLPPGALVSDPDRFTRKTNAILAALNQAPSGA